MPYVPSTAFDNHSHATGTLIDVLGGQKPVERLAVGDMVRTKDNGYQPVRWVASRQLAASDFAADPALRPVRIAAGALGADKPSRDLVVSQQHCLLLDDWRCELLFGEDEVLAPAMALVNDQSIRVDHRQTEVTYYHFMFDQHEIVYSNGVETESFHPAFAGVEALDDAKREELYKLHPEIAIDAEAYGETARTTLQGFEVDVLMSC
ncbi:iron-regulated protein frpC [Candidatus Rhodobacter oscarellae]|uniref:Iron-regulated protein frpC n=1 Tax=Candidatus Rhodobacter oscarellae TaxID=1675527 RepID=A0A0J9EDM7_9RHOB|nr:Hint domain-containing protein [Candidatus Rhodobacter lobularis]KMW60825.1 iron-regulated protein frpC [Candidatus Rhodobacter lobularis]